ncbi:MAG: flagellar biosynthesis anti-sigma factor FlgM [Bdellovibrionales bacterium RIFOXYD1_FULL_53_11]|nr:MAG: flagellar biosynthesis anti-sigma factor FlgM [Bdellovibrionales bacterium RIFOXYD1_FULL_53_11]
MRVSQSTANNPAKSNEASGSRKTERASQAQGAKKTDKTGKSAGASDANTEISTKGREFAKAKAVAADAPDIREQKIAELKKRIAEGKYKIDEKAVADKMVDEHIDMHGIG